MVRDVFRLMAGMPSGIIATGLVASCIAMLALLIWPMEFWGDEDVMFRVNWRGQRIEVWVLQTFRDTTGDQSRERYGNALISLETSVRRGENAAMRVTLLTISHWLLLIASLGTAFYPASLVWRGPVRRYLRRSNGLCQWCGYDLRGSAGTICSECGRDQGA